MDDEALQAAYAKRRAILGDEYVDAVTSDDDPTAAEFQDYITSTGVGGVDPGRSALDARPQPAGAGHHRRRSGRMEEFRLHAAAASRSRCHRRRGRRAAVPARRVLRRARRASPPGGRSGELRAARDGSLTMVAGRIRRARQHGQRPRGEPRAARATPSSATTPLGPERAPEGATHVSTVADVARAR